MRVQVIQVVGEPGELTADERALAERTAIADLPLSVRTRNALLCDDLVTVADVMRRHTPDTLLHSVANFGRKALRELTEALAKLELQLPESDTQAALRERHAVVARKLAAAYDTAIADLELSWRTESLLQRDDLVTVGDVVRKHTVQTLLRIPNFGRKSLNELIEVFAGLGVRLIDNRELNARLERDRKREARAKFAGAARAAYEACMDNYYRGATAQHWIERRRIAWQYIGSVWQRHWCDIAQAAVDAWQREQQLEGSDDLANR